MSLLTGVVCPCEQVLVAGRKTGAMMKYRGAFLFIFLFAFSSALPLHSHAGVFVQAGLHAGGDDLDTVYFVGGDSQTISAGGLLSAAIGYETDIDASILAKFSMGVKIDAVHARNGDVEFIRTPIEALVMKKNESFNYGLGITRHMNPELSGNGFASMPTVSFLS